MGLRIMMGIYDDHGIRFEYPTGWAVEETDEGARTTVVVQSSDGPSFAMVTTDEDRPAPAEMADEVLAAMREEYPGLEVAPAIEEIDGHPAVGHDLEFFTLDMVSACVIRCFRTPRRTILVFGQWSEADDGDEEPEMVLRTIRTTLEETDS